MSGSKRKSSSDVAGTAKKHQVIMMETSLELDLQEDDFIALLAVQHEDLTNEHLMELEAQRKDEERQGEEVTEEPKRFTMQKMERGFSLFEEAPLVFEAQDPNIERYTKITAAVQNAIQCYCVSSMTRKKKELLPRYPWIVFSRG